MFAFSPIVENQIDRDSTVVVVAYQVPGITLFRSPVTTSTARCFSVGYSQTSALHIYVAQKYYSSKNKSKIIISWRMYTNILYFAFEVVLY